MLGWSEREGPAIQTYLEGLLHDASEIVRRIGIYILNVRFAVFRDAYQKVVGPELFARGHLHELHNLLSQHFQEFSEEEKA